LRDLRPLRYGRLFHLGLVKSAPPTLLVQVLGDLDGIRRCSFPQVVSHNP